MTRCSARSRPTSGIASRDRYGCTAAMFAPRSPSCSTAAGACSRRPIRRRPPGSSRPRRRAARGCATPGRWRCRRWSRWRTIRRAAARARLDRGGPAGPDDGGGPRRGAGPPARGGRAELRPRGPPHDGQPWPAERPAADLVRVLRHLPAATAGPARRRRRRAAGDDGRRARAARRPARRFDDGRTAVAAARRPVGRQPARRHERPELADRPGRARRVTASSTSR